MNSGTYESEIAGAMKCLDEFMSAFNARDVEAFEKTFNFPSVRLASNRLTIIEKGFHRAEMFDRGALADWHRSGWDRRQVIHAGPDKVHIDTASRGIALTAACSVPSIRFMSSRKKRGTGASGPVRATHLERRYDRVL